MENHEHDLDFLRTPGDPREHYRCSRCRHIGVVRPGGDLEEHFRRVGPCPGEPRRAMARVPDIERIENTIQAGLAGRDKGACCENPVDEATFRKRIAKCGECPHKTPFKETLNCGLCFETLRANPMIAALAWRDISCKDPEGDRWTNLEN